MSDLLNDIIDTVQLRVLPPSPSPEHRKLVGMAVQSTLCEMAKYWAAQQDHMTALLKSLAGNTKGKEIESGKEERTDTED